MIIGLSSDLLTRTAHTRATFSQPQQQIMGFAQRASAVAGACVLREAFHTYMYFSMHEAPTTQSFETERLGIPSRSKAVLYLRTAPHLRSSSDSRPFLLLVCVGLTLVSTAGTCGAARGQCRCCSTKWFFSKRDMPLEWPRRLVQSKGSRW